MDSFTPFVSVVMCAYNTRPFIEQAVASVLNQTYKNWELIIVDDKSTDGTREWLKTLDGNRQVRLFFQEKNAGYVASKNFGISQAKGEYIIQCDSDDYFDDQLLQKQIDVFRLNTDIKIVACGFYTIDVAGIVKRTKALEKDLIIEETRSDYPFWFPPILVHKDVYSQVGLFTPFFMGLGDDLYWVTKANESFKIYCLKEPLYYYRYNHGGISKVLNDLKKITRPMILHELLRQRKKRGTDWLEEGAFEKLEVYEQKLLNNKKLMSNKFSKLSRKAVEFHHWDEASRLLKQALRTSPFNTNCYKAVLFYMRKRITA